MKMINKIAWIVMVLGITVMTIINGSVIMAYVECVSDWGWAFTNEYVDFSLTREAVLACRLAGLAFIAGLAGINIK